MAAVAYLGWRGMQFFPNQLGSVGHDYGWFLPVLLVGDFWQIQNGWLNLPEFTPAFCGGIPFLANPQSVFYSLPQLILMVFDPVRAVLATLVISACIGAAGTYAMVRECFRTTAAAASLAATLFLLNGFLLYRMVAGHLTYHAFGVVPILAWAVLSCHQSVPARRGRKSFATRVAVGGLAVAYLTYGGALNFQVPALLTVLALVLLLNLRHGWDWRPIVLLGVAFSWGALLSAAKLVPASVLAAKFPRHYISEFLFRDLVQAISLLVRGLFWPAALPDVVLLPSGRPLRRHEFEFGVSMVPLVLSAVAAARSRVGLHLRIRRPAAVLLIVLAAPVALTVGAPAWGEAHSTVPVLNNNTTFVRWWAIYILPAIVAAAMAFDRIAGTPVQRLTGLVMCTAIIIGQSACRGDGFYTTPGNTYDPSRVMDAYGRLHSGAPLPAIAAIGNPGAQLSRDLASVARLNDSFLQGVSSWPCYEPLFGYALELAPETGIHVGHISQVDNDRFNLVNPMHYLEFTGRPNDWRFSVSDQSAVEKFLTYHPYDWSPPFWRRVATVTTAGTLVLSIVVLASAAFARFRRLVAHRR
jgi:hypothetical protein